jgi:hypothetical protein
MAVEQAVTLVGSGGRSAMSIPTQRELFDEVDRRFHEQNPGSPERLDPDDPDHGPLVAVWLELRDEVLNAWTNEAFFEYFPEAGKLDPQDPNDSMLIEYWLDIRDRIRDDAAPKYDLYAGAVPPAPVSSTSNPYAGTVWAFIWDDGYAAGYDSPGMSLESPSHLDADEQAVWQAGVYEGQLAAESVPRGEVVGPRDTETTATEEHDDEYGLPVIRVEMSSEPLGRATLDAGPVWVVIDITFQGTLTVEPPESVRGVSVDQGGYRFEVQQGVEDLFTGLRVSGVGGGLAQGPISVGTTFGSEFTATEIRQESPTRISFRGRANLPPLLEIPTAHGGAPVSGALGLNVGVEIHPKAQPVPADRPWYEEAWDWVGEHALEIAVVGAVVVAGVAISVASGGTATGGAAAGGRLILSAI